MQATWEAEIKENHGSRPLPAKIVCETPSQQKKKLGLVRCTYQCNYGEKNNMGR
jgi:hypothetical protein